MWYDAVTFRESSGFRLSTSTTREERQWVRTRGKMVLRTSLQVPDNYTDHGAVDNLFLTEKPLLTHAAS